MAPNYQQRKRCPLNPKIFEKGWKMGLRQVEVIEIHLSTGNSCQHPPLRDLVLEGALKGSTPLLLACCQGDLSIVERIIDHWGVDFQAGATYYHPLENNEYRFWHSGIEGATPLFVAAVNGHVHIVDYLVKKGADISAKTSSSAWRYGGMTPLHGALSLIDDDYDEPLYVMGPLREKKTAIVHLLLEAGADPSALTSFKFPCWMTRLSDSNITAISALINHGMNLELRNPYHGYTVLHHWACNPLVFLMERRTAEESPFAVVKLLVKKGANVMALTDKGFTPILEAAHGFMTHTGRETIDILDFLLKRKAIDRKEKIDALELIGAVILGDPENAVLNELVSYYWQRALRLRRMKKKGTKSYIKRPIGRKSRKNVEWVTSSQLESVIKNPSQWGIQSFLVKLRIYSSKSWEAVQSFVEEFFEYDYPTLKEECKFLELLDMLWAILEMILNFNHPKEGRRPTWITTVDVVEYIVEILLSLKNDVSSPLKIETIKTSLELIVAVEELHSPTDLYPCESIRHMNTLYKLVKILADLPHLMNEENMKIFGELVRQDRRHRGGQTFLHMACRSYVNRLDRVRLLLRAGADPSAGDSKGNGPLHIVLTVCDEEATRDSAVRLLLDFGAHLDRVNKKGKTAVDFWANERELNDILSNWGYETIPKLSCLSARVIRSRKIPYKEKLPSILQKFVEMH